jgi:ABC-type sugar transport system ATPase subunit
VITAAGISMQFGANRVLQNVDFVAPPGAITGLLGANGAGKSTLLRILGGELRSTAGAVTVGEERRPVRTIASAMRSGIASAHQEGSLVPAWRVEEHFPRRKSGAPAAWAALAPKIPAKTLIEDLPPADRQLLEIARALGADPKVLLADEPTAGLGRGDKERVFAELRNAAARGCTVVIVTHDIQAALVCCDDIIVLNQGRVALSAPARDCRLEDVLAAMGAAGDRTGHTRAPRLQDGAPAVTVHVKQPGMSFGVQSGEIVGIAGGVLAKAMLRVVCGLSNAFEAQLEMASRRLPRSPGPLFRAGIAYVSRERSTEWSFTGQTVQFNLIAAVLKHVSPCGIMRAQAAHGEAASLRERFDVRAPSLSMDIDMLSGGNRQKMVLARAAAASPRVLLLDEPFSGVDAGTRIKLFDVLRRAADSGVTVLIYSQELPDLADLADRIVVVGEGAIKEVVCAGADIADAERLLLAERAVHETA